MNFSTRIFLSGILAAGFSIAATPGFAQFGSWGARVVAQAGGDAGLQSYYAWDKNCRSVSVQVDAQANKMGEIYTKSTSRKITAQDDQRSNTKCAGRSVRGVDVRIKVNSDARGVSTVVYTVNASTLKSAVNRRHVLMVR